MRADAIKQRLPWWFAQRAAMVGVECLLAIGWTLKADAMTDANAAHARERLREQKGDVWLVPATELRPMAELLARKVAA